MLVEIQKNEQFVNAINILKESNCSIDYKSATASDVENGVVQVKFTIIDAKNMYDYKELVYTKEKNEEGFVFFDEQKPPAANSEKSIFNGCKWEIWNNYGPSFCDYNWWCWSKKRTARYQNQYRLKVCRNGYVTKVDYRIVKLHCGC